MTSLLCNYWISVGRAAVMASVDGRLPWLSLGGARTELESVSSLSLLHSIYGSQVSQVLLASEDSDPSFFNPRRAQEGPVATRHSARPKSSPAICRFERDKRRHTSLQPASAAGQKRQLRARPATARTHIGGGAGRPRSALVSNNCNTSWGYNYICICVFS